MPTDLKGWQKHDAGAATYKADRRFQNREQVEGQEGEFGGVYRVSIKNNYPRIYFENNSPSDMISKYLA